MTKAEERKFRKLQIRIEELEKGQIRYMGIYSAMLVEAVQKNIAIRCAKEYLDEALVELREVDKG